jgi:tyrosyl-tRNA synthetase
MNIAQQVEYLMQGTEYGDESLKRTMAEELRQRLIDADKEGRPLRVYACYDP